MYSFKFLITALFLVLLISQNAQAAPGSTTVTERGWGWYFTCDCPFTGKVSGKGQGLCVTKEECKSKKPDSDTLRHLVNLGAKLDVNWKQTLSCRAGHPHGPAPPALGLICCCPDRHIPEGVKKTEPKTNPKKEGNKDGEKKHSSSDKKGKDDKKGQEGSDLSAEEIIDKLGGAAEVLSKSAGELDDYLDEIGAAIGGSTLLYVAALALNPF